MQFYFFSAIIPLVIISTYLWVNRPLKFENIVRALVKSLLPLCAYPFIIYYLETENFIDSSWAFYTISFFLAPYILLVLLLKLYKWNKDKKLIKDKILKILVAILSIAGFTVAGFYLFLIFTLAQTIREAATNISNTISMWKDNGVDPIDSVLSTANILVKGGAAKDSLLARIGSQTYELSHLEASESYDYPIGMKVTFPNHFMRREVIEDEPKSIWLVLESDSSSIWISALTDTNFNIPVNKYLDVEADNLVNENEGAFIKGKSTYESNGYKTAFIHVKIEEVVKSIGVLEHMERQLQVRITDRRPVDKLSNDLFREDVISIIKSIELD